jgi:hypothetical protein
MITYTLQLKHIKLGWQDQTTWTVFDGASDEAQAAVEAEAQAELDAITQQCVMARVKVQTSCSVGYMRPNY